MFLLQSDGRTDADFAAYREYVEANAARFPAGALRLARSAWYYGALDVGRGHADWRYDELRLDDAGRVVHEIEWWKERETARWLITADDVELTWHPDGGEA
jgi:hypothetical protein